MLGLAILVPPNFETNPRAQENTKGYVYLPALADPLSSAKEIAAHSNIDARRQRRTHAFVFVFVCEGPNEN